MNENVVATVATIVGANDELISLSVEKTEEGWEIKADGDDSHLGAFASCGAALDAIQEAWGDRIWKLRWKSPF